MKRFQGTPRHLKRQCIGIITRIAKPLLSRSKYIFLGNPGMGLGYAGRLTTMQPHDSLFQTSTIYNLSTDAADSLHDGDIVRLDTDGGVIVLWKEEERGNCILMTERCNCRCIMCPQPPKKDDVQDLDRLNSRLLSLLDDGYVGPLCITGGEPTLKKTQFLNTLAYIKKKMPDVVLDVLTNGQLFANFSLAQAVAEVAPPKTTFCISLHADTPDLHNLITGTTDGFSKTINGIRNLGRLGVPVEIRFVLTGLNSERVQDFARFVGQNFPFAVHVALMGLEMTGDALQNTNSVWIDPTDYAEDLRMAVKELCRRAVPVSVYNIPLCLLDPRLWPFARQSISNWKNDYLPSCGTCQVRDKCCGVFTTSGLHSSRIKAIEDNTSYPVAEELKA